MATRRVVFVGGAVGSRGGTAAAAAAATGSAGWSWCRGLSLEFSFGKGIKRRCLAADALCREESSRSEKVNSKPHSDDSFFLIRIGQYEQWVLDSVMILFELAVNVTAAIFGL